MSICTADGCASEEAYQCTFYFGTPPDGLVERSRYYMRNEMFSAVLCREHWGVFAPLIRGNAWSIGG